MDNIEDLINDVPLFWSWLPEFLERFVRHEQSPVAFIGDLLAGVEGQAANVAKCVCLVKEAASERLGADVVENLFSGCPQ